MGYKATTFSVQEEASSDVEDETYNEKPSEDESSLAKKITISTSCWMKKEWKKTKKKRNPLLLAWTKMMKKRMFQRRMRLKKELLAYLILVTTGGSVLFFQPAYLQISIT